MSQLSRNDIRLLAVYLQENATSHSSSHHIIRSNGKGLPARLKDSKVVTMLADTRGVAKSCHLHERIASLVISNLFADLQKEVNNSKLLLDRCGPYLRPEESYMLERVKVIEGMWSPPTRRTGPFKVRYWDYQVNKCRACMLSRIASDSSALRDIRTAILAGIDSSPNSADRRLVPGQPTILTLVNEWICLSERADEIFYYSGNGSASIKKAKNMVDAGARVAVSTSRRSGSKISCYPCPSCTGNEPLSVSSSYQSIGIFTPTHTPEASTSSDYSTRAEWQMPTRHDTPVLRKDYHGPPTHQRGFSNGISETSNRQIGSTLSHDSDTSFILRDPPSFSLVPPIPPRSSRRMLDNAAIEKPVVAGLSQWQDTEIRFVQAGSRMVPLSQGKKSRTTVDDRRQQPKKEEGEGEGYDEELATHFRIKANTNMNESAHRAIPTNANDEAQNEPPLVSRWSEASSVDMWSDLLQKATTASRGPRLGKVKSGKPVLMLDAGKARKEEKRK